MNIRTDLAMEKRELLGEEVCEGVESSETQEEHATITRIKITNTQGEQAIGKPIGNYVTVEVPSFSHDSELFDGRLTALSRELAELLPKEGLVLVAGLGNGDITPDALGPKAASYIFATRHIQGEIAKSAGLDDLRPVAVLVPGVLGQTGMEASEIIKSVAAAVKPAAVVVIDALASRNLNRLGCTVQISDTGISPGSGVGNHRNEISTQTVGVPVISMGVPTVVDAATLTCDLAQAAGMQNVEELFAATEPLGHQMMVTPREVDLLIERAARLIAMGINCALHPDIEPKDMMALVS